MKFRTEKQAEETLAKILKCLEIFRHAEEAIEHDFFSLNTTTSIAHPGRLVIHRRTCKNPKNLFYNRRNTRYIESGLHYRHKLWPLNKSLLYGTCPRRYEFDLIEEPTVFIKVPDVKVDKTTLSERKIQYTDEWNHLNSY